YSGGMALGAVLGPVVAAGPGWQGNFYLCAPIAVVLLFACWRFIHADEDKKQNKKQRIDFIGIVILTVTLVSFLVAITFSGSLATNLLAFLVPLIIGVIFLILFLIVEK